MASTAMSILKARNVGIVFVRTADDAEVAIGGRPTAYDNAFLVAPSHPKFPMLSD
jgi:hypothetical protein